MIELNDDILSRTDSPIGVMVPEIDDAGTRMVEIVGLIDDPEASLADISKLIALEIASVIQLMGTNDPAHRKGRSFRDLNDHVKALRELQRTLTEADELSKKDVLNLDGPKFQFIFNKLMDYIKKAMKDYAIQDDVIKQVMLGFGDMLKENDEVLRRDLNKIETGR